MSEKTEQPTPQKLRKAREDGQAAKSKDFTQTVLILALFGYMLADAPEVVRRLGEMMVFPVGVIPLNFEDAVNTVMTQLMRDMLRLLLPYLLIVIGLGLFIELLQTGMMFSLKAMMPSGKKLNVATNLKNIFGMKNLMEFLKSTVKIVILAAIIYAVLREELGTLLTLPLAGLVGVGVAVGLLLKSMIVKISLGYVVIALADFIWQRKQHTKQLMMSKDEVKQEFKQSEGDPHIKHQRKHLHQEMLNEGAVQHSRQASVVVSNPTHVAVALKYREDETPLPLVLAKGQGALAERMMHAAREAGVPVMQNIPLAWALLETAEVGEYIPSELIEPVAQVLLVVRDLNPRSSP